MPASAATAPGKIILFGEHAVVYGRPAIAAPVTEVRARAVVTASPLGASGQVRIIARDIGLDSEIDRLEPNDPLAQAIRVTARMLGIDILPALRLEISSTIPIAGGLASGTAISIAIARALSTFLGHPLSDENVSSIAFQVDHIHHGTPSGIDNAVIVYAQPVWFIRGQPIERLQVEKDITIVIGNTGVPSLTAPVVGDIRQRWQKAPGHYERLFDKIQDITQQARLCIEQGATANLGKLISDNHILLQELDVSSPELDRLVEAAMQAGASGAKLCGAGRGGNMIALVDPEQAKDISEALLRAGASHVITTTIHKT